MQLIAIIGGTGMLGAPVAKAFASQGFKVRIISRNAQSATAKLGDSFEYRQADLASPEQLSAALTGCDWVHINANGHSKHSYYQSHVVGTQNILKALKNTKITGISMISNAAAYPELADRWDNKYKLEAEALLKASGIPYLVFMPNWFAESLELFQQKEKLVHIGKSTQPIHWLTAEDYAQVVVEAVRSKNYHRRIPIYGPKAYTMTQATELFANHKKLKIQRLPVWLGKAIGWLSRDEGLIDVSDLMAHCERYGERDLENALRTQTSLEEWIACR